MDSKRQISCCFTGHRVLPSDDINLSDRVYESVISLYKKGYRRFLTGGAVGFDTVCAECLLSLKAKMPDILSILVLPCKNQTENWKQSDRDKYYSILSQSDEVIYTSQEYVNGCMQIRDRFLIDNSNFCVAYLNENKKSGGTFYTVRYAEKCGIEVLNLSLQTKKEYRTMHIPL